MSSIIFEDLELKGNRAQLASFGPQYLNQLRRSGKDVEQIKDLSELLLIEWNGILLDKYDGRALLGMEDLVSDRGRSDSLRQKQQNPSEKYEEDICDIYRFEDFMSILGDSYKTISQDQGLNIRSTSESSFKTVGWSYNNDNIDVTGVDDINKTISDNPLTEETIKQESIPNQKELILNEFQELSTNLPELIANQSKITEEMLKSLDENENLAAITKQLQTVNEYVVKLNKKLKQTHEEPIIKWRPAIQVPVSMTVPEDEALNKIIERTVQFFKTANKEQLEKFKEAQINNEKLAFLKSDHALHQYFEFLLKPEQQQAQMIIMQKFNEEKRQHLEKIVQEQRKIQEEREKIENEAVVPKKIEQIIAPPFEIKMFIQMVAKLIRRYGKNLEEMLKKEENDNKNFDFFNEESPLRQYFEDQKSGSTPKISQKSNKNEIKQENSAQKTEEEIKNERKRKMKDFLANLEAKGEITLSSISNNNSTYERETKRQKLT